MRRLLCLTLLLCFLSPAMTFAAQENVTDLSNWSETLDSVVKSGEDGVKKIIALLPDNLENLTLQEKLVLIGISVVILLGIGLGVANIAVFYFSVADMLMTCLPGVFVGLAYFLQDNTSDGHTAYNICFALIGVSLLWMAWRTLRFNRFNPVLFIPVMAAKVLFVVLIPVLALFCLSAFSKDGKQAKKEKRRALGILGIIGGLCFLLINGQRVYERRYGT
jgi:hypothetical protein